MAKTLRIISNRRQVTMITVLAAAIVLSCLFLFWPRSGGGPNFIVWHSYTEGSAQSLYIEKIAIPMLESKYRGIEAEAVYIDKNVIFDRITHAKGDDALPDVVFLSPDSMAGAVLLDVLAPLDDGEGVTDIPAMTSIIKTDMIFAGTVEGRAYGLPVDVSVQALLYDPALLDGAGAAPPSTLNEFWNILGKPAFAGGDTAGFILPDAGMKSLAPFVWSTGGELSDNKGEKAYGYLNSGQNIEVFKKIAVAINNGQILVAEGEEDALIRFAEGRAAMTLAGPNEIALLDETYPDLEYETAAFPAGAVGSISVMDCNFACITQKARKDIAGTFLAGVLSSDVMKTGSAFPAPEKELLSASLLPRLFSVNDMQDEFLSEMKQISDGSKTAQQALNDFTRKYDANLP